MTEARPTVSAVPEPPPSGVRPSTAGRRRPATDRTRPVPSTAPAAPAPPRAELVERVLDELVEGIERAAADLGIEV